MKKNILGIIALAFIILIPSFAYADTLWSSNGSSIYNTNFGKVGIGTTLPLSALHLAGTSSASNFRVDTGIDIGIVATPSKPTLALAGAGAGNVDNGAHSYYVTFYTVRGETNISSRSTITVTDKATNGRVTLTIPTSSDYRTIGRKIYRSKSPDTHYWNAYLVATITNNTATTYVDNVADASLTGDTAYWRQNTTNSFITVNGQRAITFDTLNTFLGLGAGNSITTGGENVFVGGNAGTSVTTGDRVVAIGPNALAGLTTGEGTIGIGYSVGGSVLTGNYNTLIGYSAAKQAGNSSSNTIIGAFAGMGTSTKSGSVFLGYSAGRYETANNKLFIDSIDRSTEIAGRKDSLIYGVFNVIPSLQTLSLGGGGKVGIGTTTPREKLDVNGNVNVNGDLILSGSIISDGDICIGVCR